MLHDFHRFSMFLVVLCRCHWSQTILYYFRWFPKTEFNHFLQQVANIDSIFKLCLWYVRYLYLCLSACEIRHVALTALERRHRNVAECRSWTNWAAVRQCPHSLCGWSGAKATLSALEVFANFWVRTQRSAHTAHWRNSALRLWGAHKYIHIRAML